ncbi:MAG: DUF4276 family protein [Nitrospiraceae bacterium]|nr:DUF4276 family protein [Nitrospiraceae bacterium]
MKWVRLYVTAEGQSERKFAEEVLGPHLAIYYIDVRARVVLTNRKLGKRGGIIDYDKIRGDLHRLMQEDPQSDARFTTMIDLYALPNQFPGWTEAKKLTHPQDRIKKLEESLKADFPDRRFMPYIQLHEFEALLYCDLSQLKKRLSGSEVGLRKLEHEVKGIPPEEIDEGATTAPSKRIIRYAPTYEKSKVRVGVPAAAAIGLSALRNKCPHFNSWVTNLEALAPTTGK